MVASNVRHAAALQLHTATCQIVTLSDLDIATAMVRRMSRHSGKRVCRAAEYRRGPNAHVARWTDAAKRVANTVQGVRAPGLSLVARIRMYETDVAGLLMYVAHVVDSTHGAVAAYAAELQHVVKMILQLFPIVPAPQPALSRQAVEYP